MKLLQWSPVFLAALSASAQNIVIAAPSNGSSIQAGSNFTVEIDQPVRVSVRLTYIQTESSTGQPILLG